MYRYLRIIQLLTRNHPLLSLFTRVPHARLVLALRKKENEETRKGSSMCIVLETRRYTKNKLSIAKQPLITPSPLPFIHLTRYRYNYQRTYSDTLRTLDLLSSRNNADLCLSPRRAREREKRLLSSCLSRSIFPVSGAGIAKLFEDSDRNSIPPPPPSLPPKKTQ